MASRSFSLSHQFTARRFAVTHKLGHETLRRPSRAITSCTSAGNKNARQTASFYEVLGVQTAATLQEIKLAYRKLARVLHPDVASDGGGDEFMRVHTAYATLADPEKREVYDRSLCYLRRTAESRLGSNHSELTLRRTWETDQCW